MKSVLRLIGDYRVVVYAAALGLTTLTVSWLVLSSAGEVEAPLVVIALAAVAAAAERGSVRLSSNTEQSISLLPTLFAAVVFGPVEGLLVGAASNLGDLRRPYLKWAVYTSTRALGGAAAGVAAVFGVTLTESPLGSLALATACGGFAIILCDVGFSVLTYKIKQNGAAADVLRAAVPVVAPVVPLWMPLVALLAFSYEEVSPWTLLLFSLPALAAHRSFVLYQEQRRLTTDLRAMNDRLEGANLSFATALVATLDARDRYTAGHSAAVAIYSRDIARRLGLDEECQQRCYVTGLVHDIGKIGLPAGLLEKPGALTLDERRQMQEHSAIGERILAKVDTYPEVAQIVRHHHERVDGTGYPDGLKGEEIPLLSRIIAVADAYNAMTSDRPYRDAMPSRVARLRLAQAVESQFDTTVVAAFEAILAGADERYRMGQREDFQIMDAPALQIDERDAA
jgi:putative nucleotidyltransferase with HDIG domain